MISTSFSDWCERLIYIEIRSSSFWFLSIHDKLGLIARTYLTCIAFYVGKNFLTTGCYPLILNEYLTLYQKQRKFFCIDRNKWTQQKWFYILGFCYVIILGTLYFHKMLRSFEAVEVLCVAEISVCMRGRAEVKNLYEHITCA